MNEDEPMKSEINSLKITPESREYLEETAKWGRVVGIAGYLFSSLIVLLGIISFLWLVDEQGVEEAFVVMISFFLIMGILLLFPSYFIFSFSKKVKDGLSQSDSNSMSLAMKDLKSTFRLYGIFIIIGVVLYIGLTMYAVNFSSNYNSF